MSKNPTYFLASLALTAIILPHFAMAQGSFNTDLSLSCEPNCPPGEATQSDYQYQLNNYTEQSLEQRAFTGGLQGVEEASLDPTTRSGGGLQINTAYSTYRPSYNTAITPFLKPAFTTIGSGQYHLLEGVGDFKCIDTKTGRDCPAVNLSSYLANLFKIMFGGAAVIAVLSLVFSGVQYIASSTSLTSTQDAVKRMTSVGIGGAIAISSYVILLTINPDLVTFNLQNIIPPLTVPPPRDTTAITSGNPSLAKILTFANVSASARDQFLKNVSPQNQAKLVSCPTTEEGVPELTPEQWQEKAERGDSSEITTPCQDLKNEVSLLGHIKPGIGTVIKTELRDPILALASALTTTNTSWRITEAWPPTANHKSNCHYDGSCFDANVYSNSADNKTDNKDIVAFIEATFPTGLLPHYEVATEAEKTTLVDALNKIMGSEAEPFVTVTGTPTRHFHVTLK